MQTPNELKIWQTHPLSNLSTSNKELSPIEKREFLYRQEMNTEKMFRMWEDYQKSVSELVEFKKHEISSIFSANREYMQWNNQLLESVNSLWDWIYGLSNWLDDISKQIESSYKMNYEWFSSLIKWLGIVNNNMENLELTIEDWVKWIIDSINDIWKINTEVLSSLEKIDHKLWNPKKIAWLEAKRDAYSYYKNWWYEESIKASNNALEYIFTDYDTYFLQWIIYLEEERDYKKAKDSFEKAIKYSKPENKEIYSASLYKLAIINFIEWDFEKAFSNQLEAIKYNDSWIYWINLARYSMYVDKKDIFEDALYQALLLDKLNIIKALTDYDFKDHEWKIEIIEKVINHINEEKIKLLTYKEIKLILNWKYEWLTEEYQESIWEDLKDITYYDKKLILRWIDLSKFNLNIIIKNSIKYNDYDYINFLIKNNLIHKENIDLKDIVYNIKDYTTWLQLYNTLINNNILNINDKDTNWNNLLHLICYWCESFNIIEIIGFLTSKWANINAENNYWNTFFHLLLKNNPNIINEDFLKYIVNLGYDMNIKKEWLLPIQIAIKENFSLNFIEILIDYTNDINILDEDWNNLLHLLIKRWLFIPSLKWLFDNKNNNWESPIDIFIKTTLLRTTLSRESKFIPWLWHYEKCNSVDIYTLEIILFLVRLWKIKDLKDILIYTFDLIISSDHPKVENNEFWNLIQKHSYIFDIKDDEWTNLIARALERKRFDIIKLLFDWWININCKFKRNNTENIYDSFLSRYLHNIYTYLHHKRNNFEDIAERSWYREYYKNHSWMNEFKEILKKINFKDDDLKELWNGYKNRITNFDYYYKEPMGYDYFNEIDRLINSK